MTPKVSVVVPLYNKGNYIERALLSIFHQTFRDFEVIVIDDGSTDGGGEVAAKFAGPRLRLLRCENSGPGKARNLGLEYARGELAAFLDADDAWHPEFLTRSVELLDRSGGAAAAVVSGYYDYPSGKSTQPLWAARGLTDGPIKLTPDMNPLFVVHLLAYMSSWSTVARKTAVLKLGGFYAGEKCTYGEDSFLWLKMLINHPIIVNMEPLVNFHREASSLSRSGRLRKVEPLVSAAEEIRKVCPLALRDLLAEVIAIRTLKTACLLGYWGKWREAKQLVRSINVPNLSSLPYYRPSLICTSPIAGVIGAINRFLATPILMTSTRLRRTVN